MREYISEATWSKILIFLKGRKDIYIGDENRCKGFMEAIYWMSRTGAQWRELPEGYGNWNTVYVRFNAWSKKDIWGDFLTFCIQDPDFEWFSIDATVFRAHPCAAGYRKGKQAEEALGRSRGGFSCKLHVVVDALGNLLKFILTPGQASDILQGPGLVDEFSNSPIIADTAYDSNDFRAFIKIRNCTPVIPSRANRTEVIEYDKHLYKERHVVECFFSKIKHFRRIFSRFDKSARNFGAFIAFVGAFLWLR